MHDLKLGPPPHQNSPVPFSNPPMSNSHLMTGHQLPPVISPQHKGQMSTTVTYSGPPRSMYPYNNNPSSISNSPENNNQQKWGLQPPQPNVNNHELKMNEMNPVQTFSPQSPIINRNGISNGHEDLKSPIDQTFQNYSYQSPQSQNQASPMFQQQRPPGPVSPQHYQQPQGLSNLSNTQSFPPVVNPETAPNPNQMFSAMPQQAAYQNIPSQAPPVGFTPSPTYQAGSPQYSGIVSSPPNSGGMWPNQQYPAPAAPSPGNYPYPPQSQPQPRKLDLDQMPSTVSINMYICQMQYLISIIN